MKIVIMLFTYANNMKKFLKTKKLKSKSMINSHLNNKLD